MKTHVLLLCFVSFLSSANAASYESRSEQGGALVISSGNPSLKLVTSNICYNATQLILCKGDPFLGINPSLGWSCAGWSGSPSFNWLFDFAPGADINGIAISDSAIGNAMHRPFFISHDSIVTAYTLSVPQYDCIPVISVYDSVVVPRFSGMKANHSYLVTISDSIGPDNVKVFGLQLQPLFTFTVPFNPKRLFVDWNYLIVTGSDNSGAARLFVYNLSTSTVVKDTLMGSLADNPHSLSFESPFVSLLSSPGDSVIAVTRYNINTSQLTASVIYSQSGLQAADYAPGVFYYQTFADSTPQATHMGITVYEVANNQFNFYSKNQRYKVISHPANAGTFYNPSDLNVVLESATNNQTIVLEPWSMNAIDTFTTSNHASYFANDFRCPVSVAEYDDDQTEIIVFPNPTDGDFTVHMKGLYCDRDYKVDVVDMKGNVVIQKQVQAKHTYTLDFEQLKSGSYVLRLHTQQGLKTIKIIKR